MVERRQTKGTIGDTILQFGIHRADRISGTSIKTAHNKENAISSVFAFWTKAITKNDHRKRVNQPIQNGTKPSTHKKTETRTLCNNIF
jgi:hypothetical protein